MGISSTTPILDLASVAFNPGTDADSARANILRSSTYMVGFLNAGLIARYKSAYADYVTNMQSGQNVPAERRYAPHPPMGWELAPANEDGFVFYQIGTTPVCPQGPDVGANFDNAAPVKDPNHIHVGAAIPGGGGAWFSVGAGDGTPNGFRTPPMTSDDGVAGIFQKFGAPVGPGWYLRQ